MSQSKLDDGRCNTATSVYFFRGRVSDNVKLEDLLSERTKEGTATTRCKAASVSRFRVWELCNAAG